jgi:phospholipid/cholesterol/gamma-HCH transport system substrate-binding protein
MNLELSRRQIVAVLTFTLVSLALLGFMLARLGAVALPGSSSRSVQAVFANAEGLPAQSDVLVHGVRVGSVSGIAPRGDRTLVTLTLGSNAPELRAGAYVRVGFKTALGEPFVELDPGHPSGSRLRPDRLLAVRQTVAIDDALSFLGPRGRGDLRGALVPLGAGAVPAATSLEVSSTTAALSAMTASVAQLVAELRGQSADLSGVVSSGRVVLDALASRTASLRGLVSDARTTLSAVADQRRALGATLDRLPALLRGADVTLREAQPLIARATPLVHSLAVASPDLSRALRALPAVSAAASQVLARAGAIRSSVLPALAAVRSLSAPASTVLARLGPDLADIVPVAQYLGPRGRTIAAWFANTADLGSHGDAKGDWARFFVTFDPATLLGLPSGAPPGNSYTAPGDAANNAPYRSGGYPRLMPYSPALGG